MWSDRSRSGMGGNLAGGSRGVGSGRRWLPRRQCRASYSWYRQRQPYWADGNGTCMAGDDEVISEGLWRHVRLLLSTLMVDKGIRH
jgi:hypothetical protein